MSFGDWLRKTRTDKRITGAELEKLSSVSRQYISNLERGLLSEKNQLPIQPSIEVVEKLAKALHANKDDALIAAGYAPKHLKLKPTNFAELIEALEALGLPVPILGDDWKHDDEDYQEALDRIRYDLEAVIKRNEKARKNNP